MRGPLFNRIVERARLLRLSDRLLVRRASGRSRTPVIVVPSVFGTKLMDAEGRSVWGSVRRLYSRPGLEADAEQAGLLGGFPLIPGLLEYDVFGGMLRFLEDAAGYRRGEDLFALEYDWRTGVVDGARALAALVDRVRGYGDEHVDLVCVSTGGIVCRYYLAYGNADVVSDPDAEIDAPGHAYVDRIVYIGVPQRGSYSSVNSLNQGWRMAPFGRFFPPEELATLQTCWEFIPHPDDPLFVDERGNVLDLDTYDADTWRTLGLAAGRAPALQQRLDNARDLHRAMDRAKPPTDSFVIGARNWPTAGRILVRGGKGIIPACEPQKHDPFVGFTYEPGDSSLGAASLLALPGLDPERVWWVEPKEHIGLPSLPSVHRLVLEALLATQRAIPATDLKRTPHSLPMASGRTSQSQ